MPKGQLCNPPTHRDGTWFHHSSGSQRMTLSNTAAMFKETEELKAQCPEWRTPLECTVKSQKDLKTEFPFSSHDNRHSMQNTVQYFDLGFGRKKAGKHQSLHTSQNFILWSHDAPPSRSRDLDGHSNYQASYSCPPDLSACEPTFHRRYAKNHKEKSVGARDLPKKDATMS